MRSAKQATDNFERRKSQKKIVETLKTLVSSFITVN